MERRNETYRTAYPVEKLYIVESQPLFLHVRMAAKGEKNTLIILTKNCHINFIKYYKFVFFSVVVFFSLQLIMIVCNTFIYFYFFYFSCLYFVWYLKMFWCFVKYNVYFAFCFCFVFACLSRILFSFFPLKISTYLYGTCMNHCFYLTFLIFYITICMKTNIESTQIFLVVSLKS